MEEKILKYLEGTLSKEEQKRLLHWLKQEDNRFVFNTVKREWWFQKSRNTGPKSQDYRQLMLTNRLTEKQHYEKISRHLKIYKYAAAVLLLLSLAGSMFFSHLYQDRQDLKVTEIQTDLGQISQMTLPDGSKVWINSGTKLTYNNQYGINNREIEVNGEAFFSVVKNKKVPFIVEMSRLKVAVTGTQFGVSNYEDSKTIEVILQEGSVNIQSANNKLLMKLSPKEMACFNKQAMTIEKKKVNPQHYLSWKNGVMHAFELPLEQLVLKLEKRFNQKFEVDPVIKDLPYTFSIEKESLSDVLYLLEKISPVKAIQEGNAIKLKYEPKMK